MSTNGVFVYTAKELEEAAKGERRGFMPGLHGDVSQLHACDADRPREAYVLFLSSVDTPEEDTWLGRGGGE